jgi:hypothetical protein
MVRSGIRRSNFQDAGLRRRFAILLLEKLWTGIEQTIPFVSQDRASTKAAYQFLSNDRVSEHKRDRFNNSSVLTCHPQAFESGG